jgi:broad specificity phosphatase PhoE
MSPTTVIFCRHGESEGNVARSFGGHGADPLTDKGRRQAHATGQRLQSAGIDAIYSSDLVRAVETAEIIARALGLQVELEQALRERSVGIFTGLTFAEAQARHPHDYESLLRSDPEARPPGGESYQQCAERVHALLQALLLKHAGQRVLLVSHQLTISLALLWLLGLELPAAGLRVYFGIDHCALQRIECYADGVRQVLALNDVAHLHGLQALESAG